MMKPNITPVGTFQRITNTAPLRAETREAIQNTVLQFYVQNSQPGDDAEGLTACYERLSQEDKLDGESNSIINQKKILEKYCRDHGYTAIRHYDEDDGYSGTNFNRPGFQRMLADIKAGKRIYEDNISGKLSDDRFIKLSRDYEQEQEQLKAVVETLGREVKQQEQKKTNVRKFISVVKKYTDMTQLDATILREFVEQIRVSDTYTTDEQQKRVKIREIEIVYNFIGAFDFEGAREQSQTAQDKNNAKVGAA